ncbi:MAG TPA: DUF371 domain-containing protein [Candidatus Dormibacteraeota bacterium]|nr:DUF371 domain-containing protein [Candidatus Dormibacteraeota bacterium]
MTSGLEEATVTFSCRGHPAIRGTHAKTLELTREREISARATCVVGVGAEVEPEDLAGFVGPLSITLRAGPHQETLWARAEPTFRLSRSIVVRRSRHRSPDTFAVEADRGAADLDRELVASLRHPDARLVVTVRGRRSVAAARGARLTVIVGGLEGPPSPLLALLGSVDLILAERAVARTLRDLARSPVATDGREGLERALRALEAGQRVAVVTSGLVPGLQVASRLAAAAVAAAVPLDFVGVPDEIRALLVSGLAGEHPVTIGRLAGGAGHLPSRPGVWWVSGRALGGLLAEGGRAQVCVVLDPRRPLETAVRGEAGSVRRRLQGLPSPSGNVLLVVAPSAAPEGWPWEVETLLAGLLRRGLPARLLAQALADLPGVDRRRAYTALVGLRHGLEGGADEGVGRPGRGEG